MSMFDVKKIVVDPEILTARIEVEPDVPLSTSDDLEGTTRVLNLLPQISEHVCVSPKGRTFGAELPETNVVHLLEHVTVELLMLTGRVGDTVVGRTDVTNDDRLYEVRLDCWDDTLTMAALSSAAWILDWAYSGGNEPHPDIEGIVGGIIQLVDTIDHV